MVLVLGDLLFEDFFALVEDCRLDWFWELVVDGDSGLLGLYFGDHVELLLADVFQNAVPLASYLVEGVGLDAVDLALELVVARELVDALALEPFDGGDASGDGVVHFLLRVFEDALEGALLLVDHVGGLVLEAVEDLLALPGERAELVVDDFLGFLGDDELDEGFAVLLLELLEDVVSAEGGNRAHI